MIWFLLVALKYSRPLYYVEICIVGYREYATDGESQSCLPLKENTIWGVRGWSFLTPTLSITAFPFE